MSLLANYEIQVLTRSLSRRSFYGMTLFSKLTRIHNQMALAANTLKTSHNIFDSMVKSSQELIGMNQQWKNDDRTKNIFGNSYQVYQEKDKAYQDALKNAKYDVNDKAVVEAKSKMEDASRELQNRQQVVAQEAQKQNSIFQGQQVAFAGVKTALDSVFDRANDGVMAYLQAEEASIQCEKENNDSMMSLEKEELKKLKEMAKEDVKNEVPNFGVG